MKFKLIILLTLTFLISLSSVGKFFLLEDKITDADNVGVDLS